jgi:hypothetical protein
MPDQTTQSADSATNYTTLDFPAGTRLHFEQTKPPEGWKLVAVHLLCEKE